ncbi:hypothetical protein BAJUN_01310 [Bajunvirus bajun]|uniref:Uncharacterized protein n=1 Tax=Brevundimonas phage vB_BgoS-Bajun TaxID=2948594 RepID=A0A9E7N7N0_9CAUD|nr:hypothetical protein BAJUN_01310 [Brevundimonas phage vB_BgoS-Bajun]
MKGLSVVDVCVLTAVLFVGAGLFLAPPGTKERQRLWTALGCYGIGYVWLSYGIIKALFP